MRNVLKIAVIVLFALGAVVAIGLHGLLNGWFVPKRSVADLSAFLAPTVEVHLPPGATTPVPVVVLFPGCAGLYQANGAPKPVTETYRDLALDNGVAVMIVDSFTPRGFDYDAAVAAICSGRALRGAERAGDVIAALDMIGQDPRLDADRIGLTGWSHGGWTIMDALSFDMVSNRPFTLRDGSAALWDGVREAFLVYPYCSFPARTAAQGWLRAVPATALLVTDDALAPEEDCLAAFERLSQDGVATEVIVFDGATHAFDEADTPDDHPVFRYDPDRAAEAHAHFEDFLSRLRDAG